MRRKNFVTWILAALCVGALSFGAACGGCDGGTGEGSSVSSSSVSGEESSSMPDESSVEESSSEESSSSEEIPEKTPSEGLEYTLSEDETQYSVTGIGSCEDTDVVISSTYEGKSVTSIGDEAFYWRSNLTSITIPDSVTSIGEGAFWKCSGLASIIIPDSVTSIGERAFAYCSSLTSIVIPDSVTSIGSCAFLGCSSLTRINVSENNTTFSSVDGILYDKEQTCIIEVPLAISGSITIPDSVTSIGNEAFRGCSSLTSIVIPDSVTSIGGRAFSGCSGLTSIKFNGTIEQWNKIEKGYYWNRDDYGKISATKVVCIDGEVAL